MQVEKDGNRCDLRVKICVASVSWIISSVFSSALRTSTESTVILWNMHIYTAKNGDVPIYKTYVRDSIVLPEVSDLAMMNWSH